ncbi:MAG: hypothetical protein HY744_10300 [Deltaproteobacteria bacterium]|nr:hypothetical protein [Deltaproteobacteria bacterium]
MRNVGDLVVVSGLVVGCVGGVAACGPSHVTLDPRSVVNVNVRPTSGQLLYCPGDPFQVELTAKLKDGTSCSSVNRQLGCMGKSDAVIDPETVRITGSSGAQTDEKEKWVWLPGANPLDTASTGMTLKGWIEATIDGQALKSMEGESELKPVYQCMRENILKTPGNEANDEAKALGGLLTLRTKSADANGANGRPGPDLKVFVTALSTPFYPDAALIRIDSSQGVRRYVISQSADQSVRIVSKGQSGARGVPGRDGTDGSKGYDASGQCEKGGKGGGGTDGTSGNSGGDGGIGGAIQVMLDEAAADKLKGRLIVASVGGDAGPGGFAGRGGSGGAGGKGGPDGQGCKGERGDSGTAGKSGDDGQAGQQGPGGPEPTWGTGSRETLFGSELGTIKRIEEAKGK